MLSQQEIPVGAWIVTPSIVNKFRTVLSEHGWLKCGTHVTPFLPIINDDTDDDNTIKQDRNKYLAIHASPLGASIMNKIEENGDITLKNLEMYTELIPSEIYTFLSKDVISNHINKEEEIQINIKWKSKLRVRSPQCLKSYDLKNRNIKTLKMSNVCETSQHKFTFIELFAGVCRCVCFFLYIY